MFVVIFFFFRKRLIKKYIKYHAVAEFGSQKPGKSTFRCCILVHETCRCQPGVFMAVWERLQDIFHVRSDLHGMIGRLG